MKRFKKEPKVRKETLPTHLLGLYKIVNSNGYAFLHGERVREEELSNLGLGVITYKISFGDKETETYQFIASKDVVNWLTYFRGKESMKNLDAAMWLYNHLKGEILKRFEAGGGGNNPHHHVAMSSALEKYITALLNFVIYSNPHKKEFNHELFRKLGLYEEENWKKFNEISLAVYGKGIDFQLIEEAFRRVVTYVGYELEQINRRVPYTYKCEKSVGSHIEIIEKTRYKIITETIKKEIEQRVGVLEVGERTINDPLNSLEELAKNLNYSKLTSPFSDLSNEEYRRIIRENRVPTLALYLNLYHKSDKLPVIPPYSK